MRRLTGDPQDIYGAYMRRIYERAELRIIAETRRRAARGITEPGWAEHKAAEIHSFRRWLRRQKVGLFGTIPADIREIVREAYEAGAKEAAEELIAAGLKSLEPQPYTGGESVRALAREAATRLTSTHLQIFRSSEDAYREVITIAGETVVTGTGTRQTAVRDALKDFARRGITGFVDKAGRHWDLGSYAEMATRTAAIRANVQGKVEKWRATGYDKVIVSDHWEECDKCRPWESKVLWIGNGAAPKGMKTLAQAIAAGLFHPNCRHTIDVWIEGVTTKPEPMTPKGKAEARRVYRERQRQQRLARGIRQWKRIEMAATDQASLRQAHAKVLEWQRALDLHIAKVNERRKGTGITELVLYPDDARVIWAPDAVRSAREAASSRRKFARESLQELPPGLPAEREPPAKLRQEAPPQGETDDGILAIGAVAAPKEWLARVESGQAKNIQRQARLNGMTTREYRAAVKARLQTIVDGSEYRMNVPVRAMQRVVRDGRFRNQFDTKTSRGVLSQAARARTESNLMGIPVDAPGSERPVYGYLRDAPDAGRARNYGSVMVVFKEKKVKHRCSVTFCDSLDTTHYGEYADVAPMPASSVDIRAVPMLTSSSDPLKWVDSRDIWPYLEAQYMGPLGLEDIARVHLPNDPAGATRASYEKLEAMLQKHGIPVVWDEQ